MPKIPNQVPPNVFAATTEAAEALMAILNKHQCSPKDAHFVLDVLRETLLLAISEYDRSQEQQHHAE